MALKTYRVGVIGLGAVGTRMINNMIAHDRFEPVIGYDSSPRTCTERVSQLPSVNVVSDVKALLQVDSLDVLYISTPPMSHAEYVRHGISKGWKIFCEKPLGVDVSDSEDLTQEMTASGLSQAVNFVYSGAPAMFRAKQLVREGAIGEVRGAELDVRLQRWPRAFQTNARWLSNRAEGGFTREMMSHHAYLTLIMLGVPRLSGPVLARFGPDGGAEIEMRAVWDTASGKVTVSGLVDESQEDSVSFRVLGTTGALRFDNWYSLILETTAGTEPVLSADEQAPIAAYLGQLDQLAHQYDTQEQRLASFDDALTIQKLIEEMVA